MSKRNICSQKAAKILKILDSALRQRQRSVKTQHKITLGETPEGMAGTRMYNDLEVKILGTMGRTRNKELTEKLIAKWRKSHESV